ncbi:U1 small nuclear ribonucleoprotein 70 kDa [Porphyridium purpureum]|uniref:U1 small nuclear ribonucleoprotein 70 kDa n=1 Tax=Porphyridium purpureum TaxID=35688 RepID=A0A5J4YSS6_PORPP|nr:U1 small nuclear ribonucleoprotein 70 kDa [Porphyridium purpureum]|eukprot:POR0632..scf227_4
MGIHAGNRTRPAYSGQPRFEMPRVIKKMFAPRPPVPFKPPVRKRKLGQMSGLCAFLPACADTAVGQGGAAAQGQAEQASAEKNFKTPIQVRVEKQAARQSRMETIKLRLAANEKNKDRDQWTSSAACTVFVANLSIELTEAQLRWEMESVGPVRALVRPTKPLNIPLLQPPASAQDQRVPVSYAFVEFEREEDAREACRRLQGRKLDGKRMITDMERGRTVPSWIPPRLRLQPRHPGPQPVFRPPAHRTGRDLGSRLGKRRASEVEKRSDFSAIAHREHDREQRAHSFTKRRRDF